MRELELPPRHDPGAGGTVAREDAFRNGSTVIAVTMLAVDGAPAARPPAIVNTLAKAVRAGTAGQEGGARLLLGFAELWTQL